MIIGTAIAAVAALVLSGIDGDTSYTTLVLPMIGLVFVMETGSVMLQIASVKLRGKRLFRMSPLHHHFELSGWDEEKITLRFWIIGALSALIGVAFYMATVGLLN